MSQIPFEIGRVVYSSSGRDEGKYFVIISILNDEYVTIADGNLRKIDKPKKKKCKHLEAKPELIISLQSKLLDGKKIFDSEIRNCLETAGYGFTKLPRKEG